AVDRAFWLAAAAGLLASVPFVYGDAGFRGLASSYPFFAAALGLGLGLRERGAPAERTQRALAWPAAAITVALVVLGVAGPALARLFWPRPQPVLVRAAVPGTLVLAPARATSMVVSNVRRAAGTSVPRIDRRDLARMLEWAGLEPEQQAHFARARTPFALMSAYDHAGRRQALLLAPLELLREGGAYLAVEVRAVEGSRFLEVVGWRRLDGSAPPQVMPPEPGPAPEPEE
ncbi:MAG TPA: hypothetical protein VFO85_02630, partial [Vicinamibacteria bacterium]|nr:hypothetical protein [Vicinamibacteria bacterium]